MDTQDAVAAPRPAPADGRARAATQRDVAALAGVSVATVSYVASGRRDRKSAATPAVEARVREAMTQLNYRPQRAGRVLQRRRTDLIAVVTGGTPVPWVSARLAQIEDVADRHGLGVVVVRSGVSDRRQDRAARLLLDGIADAAVIVGASVSFDRLSAVAAGPLPVLVIGAEDYPATDDSATWSHLRQDRLAAVTDGLRHLIDAGCRRIGLIAEGDADAAAATAFDQALAALTDDRPAVEQVATGAGVTDQVLEVHRVARTMLDRPRSERVDAIMVNSDKGAIAVLWTAADLGLSVPGEVKVIGGGNTVDGLRTSPPLSTLGAPAEAYQPAIEALVERIGDPTAPPCRSTLTWQLMLRGTT